MACSQLPKAVYNGDYFHPFHGASREEFCLDRALDVRFGSKADIIRSVRGCFTPKSGHAASALCPLSAISRRLLQEAAKGLRVRNLRAQEGRVLLGRCEQIS